MKSLILYLTLCGIAAGQLTPTFKPAGSNGEQVSASPFITALGGTTAGKALFQMANPGAVRYLRINADNTVSQLDAATFLSAIGGGSGGGNLTSGPVTSSGAVSAIADAALTIAKTNGLQTTLDAAAQPGDSRLWRFQSLITVNGYANPRILMIGDSMIATSRPATGPMIASTFGIAGYGLIEGAAVAPAVVLGDDCSKWITGDTYQVPSTGTVTFGISGATQVEADTIKLYYVQQSGGGNFKIQTNANGAGWVDETGYTSVATAGTTAGKVITITKTGWKTGYLTRVVGVSGTCHIIGCGMYHTQINGAIVSWAYNNSSALNNIDQAATTPRAITDPILQDLGCNLVMLSHLDGAAIVNANQATFQNNLNLGIQTPDAANTYTAATSDVCTRAGHSFVGGQAVRVASTTTLPAGLSAETTYYVIYIDANTFKLATTAALAIAGTAIDITSTGSGTHCISMDKAPSWLVIGPPCGFDSTSDALRLAQASAQSTLALSRGDAFYDNRKWALPYSNAVANGLLIGTDPHYTGRAFNHWVPAMFQEIGLTNFQALGNAKQNQLNFRRGAVIRDMSRSGSSYNPSLEILGSVSIGNASGETGTGFITLYPQDRISTDPNDYYAIFNQSYQYKVLDSFGGGITFQNSAGQYEFCTTDLTSSGNGAGNLGKDLNRWGKLWLRSKISASGTTGNQTCSGGTAHGSVRFAAGSSTPIVVSNAEASTLANVLCQVYGTDTTLTSVRVTKAAASFTITPNAAATAETQVGWFLLP